MNEANLDNKDLKILAELDLNARATNSQIGKRLRINKNVVNYRIKNLEKRGIIKGYNTVINVLGLGYLGHRLYLKLQYADKKAEKRIMDYIRKSPYTWWCGFIKGRFNIASLFWTESQTQFAELWLELRRKFKHYMADSVIVVYHGLEECRFPFTKQLYEEKAEHVSIEYKKKIDIDETDKKILGILALDARASLLKIARRLKLSPGAISYRMKQLIKKKVILAFKPIVDMPKLGYTLYKVNYSLRSMENLKKLERFALSHQNVFHVDKTVGLADFEFSAYCMSIRDFYSLMDEFNNHFSKDIKDYDFFSYSELTKMSYVPEF